MCRPRLLLRPLETRPLTQLLSAARALATVRVWKIWLERRARPRSDSQDAHGLPVMAGPVRDRATVIPENARFQTYKMRRFRPFHHDVQGRSFRPKLTFYNLEISTDHSWQFCSASCDQHLDTDYRRLLDRNGDSREFTSSRTDRFDPLPRSMTIS